MHGDLRPTSSARTGQRPSQQQVVAGCTLASCKRGHNVVQADAELSIRLADGHRTRGNSALEQRSLSGLSLLPTNAVGQHLRRDEDRSLCQDREVERIAGSSIDQCTPRGPSTSTVAA